MGASWRRRFGYAQDHEALEPRFCRLRECTSQSLGVPHTLPRTNHGHPGAATVTESGNGGHCRQGRTSVGD
jgi:hypothetical protein